MIDTGGFNPITRFECAIHGTLLLADLKGRRRYVPPIESSAGSNKSSESNTSRTESEKKVCFMLAWMSLLSIHCCIWFIKSDFKRLRVRLNYLLKLWENYSARGLIVWYYYKSHQPNFYVICSPKLMLLQIYVKTVFLFSIF